MESTDPANPAAGVRWDLSGLYAAPEERILEETANTDRRAFSRLFDEIISSMRFEVQTNRKTEDLGEEGELAMTRIDELWLDANRPMFGDSDIDAATDLRARPLPLPQGRNGEGRGAIRKAQDTAVRSVPLDGEEAGYALRAIQPANRLRPMTLYVRNPSEAGAGFAPSAPRTRTL